MLTRKLCVPPDQSELIWDLPDATMQQNVQRFKVFTPRLTIDKYPSDFNIKLVQCVKPLPTLARTLAANYPPLNLRPITLLISFV